MSGQGQTIGAIVGAVVGFVATGGNPAGALKGAAYGAAIGGAVAPADLPGYEGPRLSDASEQTSGYGVGLVEADGKIRISPHCIWIENNSRREVVRKEERDGKGGGSQETTTYEYYGTAAFLLTDHQIKAIERVWTSKGLLINAGGSDLGTSLATSEIFPLAHLYNSNTESQLKAALQVTPTPGPKGQIRIYPGFDDQMPDPRMEADLGVGNTPAYRGCALMVIYDFPLPQEYGQSIAGIQFALEVIVGGSDGAAALLNSVIIPPVYDTATSSPAVCNYLSADKCVMYSPGWWTTFAAPSSITRTDIHLGSANWVASYSVAGGIGAKEDPQIGYVQFGISDDPDFYATGGFGGCTTVLGSVAGFQSNGAFVLKNDRFWGTYWITTGKRGLYTWQKGLFSSSMAGATYLDTGASIVYAITADDNGDLYGLFNGTIKKYDDTLTLLDSAAITFEPSSGVNWSTGVVRMHWNRGLIYIFFGPEAEHVHVMPDDFSSDPVYLCQLGASLVSSSQYYTRIIVDGDIAVRYTIGAYESVDETACVQRFRLPTPSGTGEDLATVVRRRIERSELIQSADIDVTDLSGTVRGYKTQGPGSVRQRIEPLMLSHQFDMIMSGYQLKAVTRGNSSVMTIDPDDLDARPYGTAPGVALGQSREMDTQLPSVVVVKALDSARDYEVNQQQSQTMAASKSVNVKEITFTEVLTPNEAASRAEIIWARSWLERTPFKFNLPQTYRALEASDVVTLPMPAATYELYLTSVNYTLDNRVECEAVLNDSALYTTNAVGSSGNVSTTVIPYGGNSQMMLLNLPALYDEYTGYGFPGAMCGYSASYPGGTIIRSIDVGQSWQAIQGFAGPVVSGQVETPLAQDDGFVINYTDQLIVKFYSDDMSISSITEAQMKSGQNWAAYGAEGRWEILLFANATDNGDGTWTLDAILRGAKGTEWATGLHEAYDQFVFLSDSDAAFIGMDINSYNVERLYRGVTAGQSLDAVSNTAFTYTGVNLKPYAPTQLDASLSGSDWVITWKRRSRYESSYFTNGVAVPLGEATEAYEIDIMNGATVVRTIDATSQTATYTSADQTTDFGAPQSSITFRVYQISAVVGRGYESEATV